MKNVLILIEKVWKQNIFIALILYFVVIFKTQTHTEKINSIQEKEVLCSSSIELCVLIALEKNAHTDTHAYTHVHTLIS